MPFLYIYSPSDFVTAPPDESGGAALGVPNFTLTLAVGATPTVIEINDNDTAFDEIDATQQTLASGVTIDGTSYAAGTFVSAAYDLIDTVSGHRVTSVHFGGDGYQQGAVEGIASTVLLVPGQTYTFNSERTSHNANNQYADYVACFTKGTKIKTATGNRLIEHLCAGDEIMTLDMGLQPLRWIGRRTVRAEGNFAPVRFESGALGNARAFEVSPEHRMLVSGAGPQLLFGEEDVLVPAKSLVNEETVWRRSGGYVTYYHLLFDEHQVVFGDGVPSEALLLCEASLKGLTSAAAREALALFPNALARPMQAARRCLRGYEGALLAA